MAFPLWQPNTYYPFEAIITDSNGNNQFVLVPGISGPTHPTWGFSGTTQDTFITWQFGLPPSGGGGSSTFTAITTGTNITATMTVGSGAIITVSGTGVVNANELGGVAITNTPSHIGQIPIVSSISPLQMNYADPLIQGLYPDGSSVASPPAFAAPTTIQPVYVAGKGADGNIHGIKIDNTGVVQVGNSGTFATQDSNLVNTIGATGSTVPTRTQQVGGSDGANLRTFSTDAAGNQNTRPAASTTANWLSAPINFALSGVNTIVAGIGGQKVRVMRMMFVNNGASTNITVQDTSSNLFTGPMTILTNGIFAPTVGDGEPYYVGATGAGIQLNSTVATQISGTVWFTQS